MFKCSKCQQSIGPGIKPALVPTGTRKVAYSNTYLVEDEYGNKKSVTVDSTGTEITGEAKICPTCAEPSEFLQ